MYFYITGRKKNKRTGCLMGETPLSVSPLSDLMQLDRRLGEKGSTGAFSF
jgi:hypothetical protein